MNRFTMAFLSFLLLHELTNDDLYVGIREPSKESREKVFSLIPEKKKEYWIKRYCRLKTPGSRWGMLNKIHSYWKGESNDILQR